MIRPLSVLALVVVAASYITLAVAKPGVAQEAGMGYVVVTLTAMALVRRARR